MNCENCGKSHNGEYGSGRFCSSKCARSFSTKSRRKEINKKVGKKLKGVSTWNKGKLLADRIEKCCKNDNCNIKFTVRVKSKKEYCSRKCNPNLGGYRKNSGAGKSGHFRKGKFHNIFCDSSWELAYVVWCLDHDIPIERNKDYYNYFWKDKKRRYYPDFKIGDILVEIKGYNTEQWKAKLSQIPENVILKVIGKKEIKKYIEYVTLKYGENFTDLYENN